MLIRGTGSGVDRGWKPLLRRFSQQRVSDIEFTDYYEEHWKSDMRLSEVFLRIGCSFTAWMVIYAYFIWLAVIERAGCTADGDEIFRLLLGMAPLAAGAAFLLRTTRPFPDIHRILRWLGIPVLGLLFLTVPVIWQILNQVNFGGGAICDAEVRAGWHSIWAPLQIAATGICVAMIGRTFRVGINEENETVGQ